MTDAAAVHKIDKLICGQKRPKRKLWKEMRDHPPLKLRNGAVLDPMNHYELKLFGDFNIEGNRARVHVLNQYMLDIIAGEKDVRTGAYRICEDDVNVVIEWLKSRHVCQRSVRDEAPRLA